MKNIVIGGISVAVTRKRIKNMYIRVTPPNGDVLVSAPYSASEGEVSGFILSREQWIKKHVSRIQDQKRPVNKYEKGESAALFGELYPLEVIEAGKPRASLENGAVTLYVKPQSTLEERALLMRKFYTDALKSVLPELILRDEAIVGRHALEWCFSEMKTRWGVCNVQKERITLNTRLATRPMECIEYVVIHELTHLIEKSHNATFKAYLDKFCPDWRSIRKLLNGKTP